MTRPNLEGLFNGSTPAQPPMTALIGKPTAPEPAPAPPAPRTTPSVAPGPTQPESAGLFDPVAIAERYFALLQTLLDMQREFGLKVAHQLADLPGMDRLRR